MLLLHSPYSLLVISAFPSNSAIYCRLNLRPRGHDLSLPSVEKVLFKIVSLWELCLSIQTVCFCFFHWICIYWLFNTYCLWHFIAMSVFVILLVLCSCNSVRMSLKLIKGNLLTYLLTYLYHNFFHRFRPCCSDRLTSFIAAATQAFNVSRQCRTVDSRPIHAWSYQLHQPLVPETGYRDVILTSVGAPASIGWSSRPGDQSAVCFLLRPRHLAN